MASSQLYNTWQGTVCIRTKTGPAAAKMFDATIMTTQYGFRHRWPAQITIVGIDGGRDYNPPQNSFVVVPDRPTRFGTTVLEKMRSKNLVAYVDLRPDTNVLVLRVQNGIRSNLVGYLWNKNPGPMALDIS